MATVLESILIQIDPLPNRWNSLAYNWDWDLFIHALKIIYRNISSCVYVYMPDVFMRPFYLTHCDY